MVTLREIKKWYDKKHLALGENAWRPFEEYSVFLKYLGPEPGKKLLDVGCGTGYLLKSAEQKGLKTFGVDISTEGAKIAQKVSPDSSIAVASGEALCFPDRIFDYVTSIGVLEHFLNMEKGLQEMKRVARDDARFCIVVPNSEYFFWKLKGKKGTEQQDINEHLMPLAEWKKIFEKAGFRILNIYQDRWFARKDKLFASLNPIKILKRAIYKLIWAFLPLKFTYQFIFIMEKAHR